MMALLMAFSVEVAVVGAPSDPQACEAFLYSGTGDEAKPTPFRRPQSLAPGRFLFDEVARGGYGVRVTCTGLAHETQSVTVEDRDVRVAVRVGQRGHRISGVVHYGRCGRSYPWFSVDDRPWLPAGSVIGSGAPNARGYVLEGLSIGDHGITLHAGGYAPAHRDIRVSGDVEGVDFRPRCVHR